MKRRGLALISVLIVAAALMGVLAVGLQLGNRGVLFVSQSHQRNVALGAAEAGVYEVVMRLENNKNFNGPVSGTLAETGATYEVTVDNQIWTGGVATVVSRGTIGATSRTLEVTLEPDTESFGAAGVAGKVYVYDGAYVNGIASPSNPIFRPGGFHSEFSGSDPSFQGDHFIGSGPVVLRATGDITTPGSISNLGTVAENVDTNTNKAQHRLDKNQFLSGSFGSTVPANGVLTGNTRINGNAVFTQKIEVPDGVTLHVDAPAGGRADAEFRGGVTGDGRIVVEGNALIQTTADFDPAIKEGVKLVADGSITVVHPEVDADDEGMYYTMDHVGDYFAQMPGDAPAQIANNLPVNAPNGGAFFSWFDSNAGSGGNAEFNLWYNGDGSPTKPGLTPATKAWLQASRPIVGDIVAWANSN